MAPQLGWIGLGMSTAMSDRADTDDLQEIWEEYAFGSFIHI